MNDSITQSSKLPPELDFFKYAQGGRGKRKTGNTVPTTSSAPLRPDIQRKRQKVNHEAEMLDDNMDDESEGDASRARVRVTAKGSDVPPPIEVFDDLLERYKITHRLLSNLRDNHYKYPTGVQAHGIPILLEVSSRRAGNHPSTFFTTLIAS